MVLKKTPTKPKLKKKAIKKIPKQKPVAKKPKRILSRPKAKTSPKRKTKVINTLKRSILNPIISPASNSPWQSKATFNPTAFLADGKVHIIYRAIGDSDVSVLGYASSNDGTTVDEREINILYGHKTNKQSTQKEAECISYSSGGGWGGGCEDPRITCIDGHVYITYTLFDGWGSVRMALTSIPLEDFLNKRWNWKEPVLISPPGQIHKNWVLFPKKINGKFAILHSISPEIMIDYFDSLKELDGKNFIQSVHQGSPLWAKRERNIRGVGPSPIETKYGWLVIYHAMSENESHRYKLWAMLLDKKDPTKVLHRSSQPILSPDEEYENNGFKSGVIYSCGAIVKDGILFVYYGGADYVSCVATADLEIFLKDLTSEKPPKLSSRKRKV